MSVSEQLGMLLPLARNGTREQLAHTRECTDAVRTQGSLRRVAKTSGKQSNCSGFIKISDPLRVKWDLFVMFLAIFNSFSIPFVVAFSPQVQSSVVLVVDASIDAFFVLDILLNFRTTYINIKTGEEVSNGWLIAKNYVFGGRFFIDFIVTVPFDVIAGLFGAGSWLLELLRLLKLMRILRLSKIISFMRAKEDVKLTIRFLQFILFLLMYLNLGACCWHLLVTDSQEWRPQYPFDLNYYQRGVWDQYAYAFYFTVELLVGSEIVPQTFKEVVYCSVSVLLGSMITAMLFGEVAVIMTNLRNSTTCANKVMEQINSIVRNLKLPQTLQYRISDYLEATQTTFTQQEEYKRFSEKLPPSYKIEVNKVLFNKVVQGTPVFSCYKRATREMINYTYNLFYRSEDLIVEQYQESDGVYFLLSGELEVVVDDLHRERSVHRVLHCGDVFGEIGIIFNCKRTASVRVSAYATVAKIGKTQFLDFADSYPQIMEELMLRAARVYNDKLTRSLDRMLKRIQYIRTINHIQYIHLLHSFQPETYVKGSVVLELGEFSGKVLFLVEGSVTVHFRSHGKDSHYLVKTIEKEQEKLCRSSTLANAPVPDRHNISSVFDLYICQVSAPSILCATQALIKGPVPIRITANSHCEFLVLYTKHIEDIAGKVTGNLKANIVVLRNRHYENHPKNDEIIKKPPVLDFVQLKQTKSEKFRRKTRLKFKHAVLQIIMKSRQRKYTGVISIHALARRLVNIAKNEGLSWGALDYKISNGTLPPETIEVTKILNSNESKKPMLKQLATVSQEAQGFAWRTESKLEAIQDTLDQFNEYDEEIIEEIQSIQEFHGFLANLIQ